MEQEKSKLEQIRPGSMPTGMTLLFAIATKG
jgi:hypothetical protein